MKDFLIKLWFNLKSPLLSFLETHAVKFALKKLLGSLLVGGFRAWAIKFIVENLFEELAKPVIDLAFRKVGYAIEVTNGTYVLAQINASSTVDEWDAATDKL
jgi:hypothetical protein